MLPGRIWAAIPTIYADGFHDDTVGFQAALRGDPFRAAREGLAVRRGGTLYLSHGTFRLSESIAPTERVPVVSMRNHYDFSGAPNELECCLDVTRAKGSHFECDYFDSGGKAKFGILDRSFHSHHFRTPTTFLR
ncbi:MAG: hypothetical protein JWR80_9509 [Bradyrhizobium sp.]|nr:hypothetical protein [Bradyrhizobium sp.]